VNLKFIALLVWIKYSLIGVHLCASVFVSYLVSHPIANYYMSNYKIRAEKIYFYYSTTDAHR